MLQGVFNVSMDSFNAVMVNVDQRSGDVMGEMIVVISVMKKTVRNLLLMVRHPDKLPCDQCFIKTIS